MQISGNRISKDIDTIASCSGAAPEVGFSRPTFSPSWCKARDYVIDECRQAGCNVRIDPAGNVHARPISLSWDEPVWLSGSHIDSVPTGGKFDGVVGIVCPLEVLRVMPQARLELIVFAEEEGTTFGIGMIGSRLWTGDLQPGDLDRFKNCAGQTYIEAGVAQGVQPEALTKPCFDRKNYRGLIELHIEQGPFLWEDGKRIGIVETIAGRKQYLVQVWGRANHAGAAPMNRRSDALAAAGEMITQIEAVAQQLSPPAVATVGRILCRPNALNVVPEFVEFTIDFRSPDEKVLADGHQQLVQAMETIAQKRRLRSQWTLTEDQPPIPMDAGVVDRLKQYAGDVPVMCSGALHDAAVLAPYLPTAMLFIASRDGISHNPAEFSRIEDIVLATEILAKMVN